MPLHFVAVMLFEEAVLLAGLDPFGNHAQAQAVRHRDHRLRNRGIVLVVRQIEDE